jgi:hypothetical protein
MNETATAGADLQSLQEIPLPQPVSWFPQTIGWLYLGIVLLIAILLLAWHLRRRWQANRYRRDALAELDAIEARLRLDNANALLELPALLKRTALGSTARARVAALSGEDWLRFLEQTAPRAGIDSTAGRKLWQLAYTPVSPDLSPADRAALCTQARRWISHHVAV